MDITKIKHITKRDKNLTFGYIREAQYLLKNENNLCYNIPEIVAYLVALYLCIAEYFEYNGVDMEISDDKRTLKYIPDSCIKGKNEDTLFGNVRINQKTKWKKCEWKFKIHIFNDELSRHDDMSLGLFSSNCQGILDKDRYDWDLYYFFCIYWDPRWSSGIEFYSTSKQDRSTFPKTRSKRIHNEDIITLELDLEKEILCLFVNGEKIFMYFKIKMNDDIEYKMGITGPIKTSITLIDFQTY